MKNLDLNKINQKVSSYNIALGECKKLVNISVGKGALNRIISSKLEKTEMIIETHAVIRNILAALNVSNNVSLLYGGSVTPENASQLAVIPNVDGFLIGGASQSSKKFIDIVRNYYK